jgi:hypothetical protein
VVVIKAGPKNLKRSRKIPERGVFGKRKFWGREERDKKGKRGCWELLLQAVDGGGSGEP